MAGVTPKRWKAVQLAGVIMLLVGLVLAGYCSGDPYHSEPQAGFYFWVTIAGVGFCSWFAGRILGWWDAG